MSSYTERLENAGFSSSAVEDHLRDDGRSPERMSGFLKMMDQIKFDLDKYDGVEPEGKQNPEGSREFSKMLDLDPPFAVAFVGLRRLERNGDLERMKAGLVLMEAMDRGIVKIEAVVEMVAPDLVPSGAELGGIDQAKMKEKEAKAKMEERIFSKGPAGHSADLPPAISRGAER